MDHRAYYPTSTALAILAQSFPGKVIVAADAAVLVLEEKTITFEETPATVFKVFESLRAEYLTVEGIQHVKLDTQKKRIPCSCSECVSGITTCSDCGLSIELQ